MSHMSVSQFAIVRPLCYSCINNNERENEMATPTIVTETLTYVLPRAIREMETILAQHYTMMGNKTINDLVDGVTTDHTKWVQNYFVRGVEIVAERDGLDLYLDNASGWDMMVNGYPVELKVKADDGGASYATGNKHAGDKTNLNWTVQLKWDKDNDTVLALSSSIISLDDINDDSGYIIAEGKGGFSTLKVRPSDVEAITVLAGGVKTNRKWTKPITTPWTGDLDNIGVTTTKVSKIAKVAPVVINTCDTHFVEILPTGVCPSCE